MGIATLLSYNQDNGFQTDSKNRHFSAGEPDRKFLYGVKDNQASCRFIGLAL